MKGAFLDDPRKAFWVLFGDLVEDVEGVRAELAECASGVVDLVFGPNSLPAALTPENFADSESWKWVELFFGVDDASVWRSLGVIENYGKDSVVFVVLPNRWRERVLSSAYAPAFPDLPVPINDLARAKMVTQQLAMAVGVSVGKLSGRRKPTAKYRSPCGEKTWSGRGLKPVWFRDYVKQHGSADALKIRNPN